MACPFPVGNVANARCPQGAIYARHGLAACCPATCGTCGGQGCKRRPGGAEQCCALQIRHSQPRCSQSHPAPCIPDKDHDPKSREEVLRLFHISKTGTTSLFEELKVCLGPNVGVISNEGCWPSVARWASHGPTTLLLRQPRAHILSLYKHCRYSGWGRWKSKNFPRGAGGAYSKTKDSFTAGFGAWLLHFRELWTDAAQVGRHIARGRWWTGWGCYHPINPQTRALTCTGAAEHYEDAQAVREWDWRENATLPSAYVALSEASMVGVLELYDEHLCTVLYTMASRRARGGKVPPLPASCTCAHRNANSAPVNDTRIRVTHDWPVGHPKRAPPVRLSQLPDHTLTSIDALTRNDAVLYASALRRAIQAARQVEVLTGQRLLCRSRLVALRAELQYLPAAVTLLNEALLDAG